MEEMKKFTVSEVAKQRGVSERAIYKQMKTHAEALEGHIEKYKGKQWLDEYAVNLLKEASGNSAPVIVEETEKSALEDEIKALKDKIKLLEAERCSAVKALENFSKEMMEIRAENKEMMAQITESKLYLEQKEAKDAKIKELEEKVDSFKPFFFGFYTKKKNNK